jgi:hypothetical protein
VRGDVVRGEGGGGGGWLLWYWSGVCAGGVMLSRACRSENKLFESRREVLMEW